MLVIGIAGLELSEKEKTWIQQPQVSGLILFKRNFAGREQVSALIESIRELRSDPFLICVDQEGGPVQRFQDGFTKLPALADIGELYKTNRSQALELAEEHAWLMASEMRAIGIDLSFAPVVDLRRGNLAIGERAFSEDPEITASLSAAYIRGMRIAGMAATVKHFPGHGTVKEDTHFNHAVDNRSGEEIFEQDLLPFSECFKLGAEAVMMAHVEYPQVDYLPAGYSPKWIKQILRQEMQFKGIVFSDDIGMAAAESVGGIAARIKAHLDAGCDLVLVCHPKIVEESLQAVEGLTPFAAEAVQSLCGFVPATWKDLVSNPQRDRFIARLALLQSPNTTVSSTA